MIYNSILYRETSDRKQQLQPLETTAAVITDIFLYCCHNYWPITLSFHLHFRGNDILLFIELIQNPIHRFFIGIINHTSFIIDRLLMGGQNDRCIVTQLCRLLFISHTVVFLGNSGNCPTFHLPVFYFQLSREKQPSYFSAPLWYVP